MKKKITKKNRDGNYVSTKEVENLHLKSVSHLIPFPWNQARNVEEIYYTTCKFFSRQDLDISCF